MTSRDVKGYVAARRHAGIRTATIRREVGAFKRGMRLAKEAGVLEEYPIDWLAFGRIKSPKDELPDERLRGKLWTLEQIESVLANLSAKAVTAGHRDLCRVILLTGLRLEEARRVRRSWIHPSANGSEAAALLRVPAGASKTGDPRVIPLVNEALEILERRGYCLPDTKPNRALALASKRAGLPGVLTPRDLRHWYLTHVERETGSMESARALAGHRSAATTARYLHSDDERAIAAGIAAARLAERGAQEGAQEMGSVEILH